MIAGHKACCAQEVVKAITTDGKGVSEFCSKGGLHHSAHRQAGHTNTLEPMQMLA